MEELYQWISENMNYGVITFFMAVESSFIPFPSEIIMIPAAYLAVTEGEMSLPMVVLFGTLGAIIGALVNYGLAWWLGRPIVYKFANSKLGHMCLITERKVVEAEQYFDRHGAVSTFVGRLIPAIRQLISIPAGLAKMKLRTFLLFTFLGAAAWNTVLVALGAVLGKSIGPDAVIAKVEEYSGYFKAGLAVVIVIGLAWWIKEIIKANRETNAKQ
jgi:membrane protein DedA with SNARE-associated domain